MPQIDKIDIPRLPDVELIRGEWVIAATPENMRVIIDKVNELVEAVNDVRD